jgi:hypothetical protein
VHDCARYAARELPGVRAGMVVLGRKGGGMHVPVAVVQAAVDVVCCWHHSLPDRFTKALDWH